MSRIIRSLVVGVILVSALLLLHATSQKTQVWRQSSFSDFIAGGFPDGGANIYVSARGRVELSNRWDLNGDGYVDLVLANTHDFNYVEPAFLYVGKHGAPSPSEVVELPSNGGTVVALNDLDRDGNPELILGNSFNNDTRHLNSYIYWGGREGFTPKRRTELPTVGVSAVCVADLNGDSYPDLVFANNGDALGDTDRSFIYWGGPEGYLPEKRTVLETHHATGCAVADLNHDGFPDLVFTNGPTLEWVMFSSKVTQSAYIYWGSANGYDASHRTELPTQNATGVSIGDLNGDGWPDLVFTNYKQGSNLAIDSFVYWGGPEGYSVARRTAVPTVGAKGSCIADLNKDGIDDLVVANFGSRLIGSQEPYASHREIDSYIYWGSKSGLSVQNRTSLPTAGASACVATDLNDDGWPDVTFANYADEDSFNTNSFTYWGGPNGFSASRRTSYPTRGATSVAAGRTAGGGTLLVFANSISGHPKEDIPTYVYWGSPEHTYSVKNRTELATIGANQTAIADLNNDGFPDLVVANSHENDPAGTAGLSVFWGGPDGVSEKRRTELPTQAALSVAVADFNRDGYLDLAFTNDFSHTVNIYWGSARGFSKDRSWSSPIPNPRYLNYADFNKDGYLDLVVSTATGEVTIFWGGPKGFSSDAVTKLPGLSPVATKAADLDHDGYLDLVVANFWDPETHSGYVNSYIYWGGPHGFSPMRRQELPTIGAHAAVIGDLNQDGLLDIVFPAYHSPTTRSVDTYIYWGQKDGVYSPDHRSSVPGDSAVDAIIYDFNDDGFTDLLLLNHLKHGDHRANAFLYWGSKEGLDLRHVLRFPSLGVHGFVALDPGNMYTRKLEHEYVSRPFDTGGAVRYLGLTAQAETPGQSSISFQVRAADTKEGLSNAPWIESQRPQGPARWLQYRAVFKTPNLADAPNLSEVELTYEPGAGK